MWKLFSFTPEEVFIRFGNRVGKTRDFLGIFDWAISQDMLRCERKNQELAKL
jgi:hypothetical protein